MHGRVFTQVNRKSVSDWAGATTIGLTAVAQFVMPSRVATQSQTGLVLKTALQTGPVQQSQQKCHVNMYHFQISHGREW